MVSSPTWSRDSKLANIKIPKEAVGPFALKALCQGGVDSLDILDKPSHDSNSGAGISGQQTEQNPAEVRTIRIQREPEDAEAAKAHQKRRISDSSSSKGEPDTSQDDPPSQKKKKRRVNQEEEFAKSILRQKGLDFNNHFQGEHKGSGHGSEHWKLFLKGVAGQADITCSICQRLITSFGINTSAETPTNVPEAPSETALTALQDQASASQDPAALQSLAVVQLSESPPKKRSRVGRPRKIEQDVDQFNLVEYLQQKRPGKYS